MQLKHLRPEINIENNDKQSDERYQNNIIDDKESDERYQISKNDQKKMTEDIEILKLQKLTSEKRNYLEKKSDKINIMDISDDKDSDKRDQISKNDEANVPGVVENQKLVNLVRIKI